MLRHYDPLDFNPIKQGIATSSIGLKKLPLYKNPLKNLVFLFDDSFADYRKEKLERRSESLKRYYQKIEEVPAEVIEWIITKLHSENEEHFSWKVEDSIGYLQCDLTEEILAFDKNFVLDNSRGKTSFEYIDAFDALAMNVQEDLVIHTAYPSTEEDASTAIHLCYPNGWSAQMNIGRSFYAIHEDIPFFTRIMPKPYKIVNAVVNNSDTFERIGSTNFRTSDVFDRHPEIPYEERHLPFHHRENPQLALRFERQTVKGFPDSSCFIFTIRTYFLDCAKLARDVKQRGVLRKIFTESRSDTKSATFIQENSVEVLKWLAVLK